LEKAVGVDVRAAIVVHLRDGNTTVRRGRIVGAVAKRVTTYDVVPIVDPPGKLPRPGPRIATGLDAKSAAKLAVRSARNTDTDGPRVIRVHVVHEGFGAYDPVMICTTGDPRSRECADAVRAREYKIAVERRGGVVRAVRCDVTSPAFKKAIAAKPRRKRR
jgi:hypothetical protein